MFVIRGNLRIATIGLACTSSIAIARAGAGAQEPAAANPPPGSVRDVSMKQYRQHLESLTTIVEACAKARDPKTCAPGLVGSDDRVALGESAEAERRLVRFDWLRVLLVKARDKDNAPSAFDSSTKPEPAGAEGVRPPRRSISQLLQEAEARLASDLAEADRALGKAPEHLVERGALKKVLAQREFSNLAEPTPRDTILEKIGDAFNRFFDRVASFSGRSPWIGRVVLWGFLGAICVGLMWGLIQLERRWRIRLIPEQNAPATGAASARDWQLWLEDARRAAAEGQWRDAVHSVYWAAISRLESKRLWPADRARTPREYLALVAEDDPRKRPLGTLTGSFERIWYGGRAAGESDYRTAEQLAQGLISGWGAR